VSGNLYLGTSGFAYPEWKGPFYPERIGPRNMLRFYASRFSSVEINYTFRHQPSEETLTSWRQATPDGFVFTLKAHQGITHWMRLANTDRSVAAFLDRARLLGPRLGPILFQCPPNLPYDRTLLEAFVAFLPPTHRYAFEFRHSSWVEARPILASLPGALCTVETDESPFTQRSIDPKPFAYLRLRKERYSEQELLAWVGRIEDVLEAGSDVYCYFKHEEKAVGPIMAERMAKMIRA
jgi:uncharacterized protein YecE (DUF72 family)